MVKEKKILALEVSTCKLWGGAEQGNLEMFSFKSVSTNSNVSTSVARPFTTFSRASSRV